MANVIEIKVRATDETGAVYDKVKAKAFEEGTAAGETFASAYQRAAQDYEPITPTRTTGARRVSFGPTPEEIAEQKAQIAALREEMESAVEHETSSELEDVLDPNGPTGTRIREDARKTGQQAGKEMGDGMSPLLVSALAGATAVGAPALLAGMGVAFAGVTALALKSNVVIANDFKTLGTAASTAFTSAAAPAAGTMHDALVNLEGSVRELTPQLQALFVNAEPDITAVTGGVAAFASGVLPGMSSALKGSQVIVADFSNSLGGLGSSVGGMFQGLTRDANTTGAGLQSLVGTVGNLTQTLGGVLGSAASAGGAALMALDPVLNTTLGLIQKISSPGTVGAAGGLFAALKLDPALSSGLKSAAGGMETLALKSMDATGVFGKMAPALTGTAGALSKGASVMAGPWGLAIGAGIGLATGLAGALFNASHASDALSLSQQGLQDAVAKDSGTMGAATAAYVAAQAQTDGLAKSAAAAGVSLDTWTQAVLGNTDAQKQVTDAVMTSNQSTLNAQTVTDSAAQSTGKFSDEQRAAKVATDAQASASNKLTDQNKQLLNSMAAQHQQIVDAINKERELASATNALTNASDIFAASLKAQYQTQVASAQQSALNSVAALNLGDSQTTLSQKIYQSETAYSLATAAAQGYGTALQSLNGTTMSLDQAQNTLAQQMVTAKTSFAQNKYSMDINTQAGVANRQALVSAAQAIQALGVAQYQATGSINKGNQTIQQQITAFVNATGATGKAKTAIQQYLESISQIPPNVSTTVNANTGPAMNSLGHLLNTINSSSATVTVRAYGPAQASYAHGGNISAAATGGVRGNIVQVGEQGPEFVRLPFGSTVIPHSNVQSMEATSSGAGTRGGAFEIHFGGNTDSAFATAFMLLVRKNMIQIKQKAIVP